MPLRPYPAPPRAGPAGGSCTDCARGAARDSPVASGGGSSSDCDSAPRCTVPGDGRRGCVADLDRDWATADGRGGRASGESANGGSGCVDCRAWDTREDSSLGTGGSAGGGADAEAAHAGAAVA